MKVKIEHASRHMWLFHNILLGRRKAWILGVGKEKDPVHKKLWYTQVRELAHKVCAVLPRHQELVCPSGPFQMSDSLTQAVTKPMCEWGFAPITQDQLNSWSHCRMDSPQAEWARCPGGARTGEEAAEGTLLLTLLLLKRIAQALVFMFRNVSSTSS